MRKQVGFTFRVYPVGRIAETYDPEALNQEIQDTYLSQGWEVLNTHVVEFVGNRVMLGVSLVQYADVVLPEEQAVVGEKRGVGRPKKVVEEVAA